MGTLVTHFLFYNSSFLLLFIVHTLAQQNILIIHPSLHHFCLSSLSAEKEKTFMPILNEQEEGKHIMQGWQEENQQFSAPVSVGEPLWGRRGEERERGRRGGRDVSRYYYHCHCAVVERNTLAMLTYPKGRTFGEQCVSKNYHIVSFVRFVCTLLFFFSSKQV